MRFRLVGEPKAELAVDLGFVRGVGVAKGRGDFAEGRHQGCDFRSAHPAWAVARVRVKLCFGAGAFGLGLSDPVPFGNSSLLVRLHICIR
ncbi:hypothetical protein AB0F68_19250 [Micromonospora sp. NPDC023966]|uniref:hypothetical protein n=1 Tax=Micromonospora sp. NPDC023966 TaxID=3154699 RepID=UPI003404E519